MNTILKNELEKIKPSKQELKEIADKTKAVLGFLKKSLAKKKIKAEIFVGGSAAKNTLIKKKKYDVDIFVRFDKKYDEKKISKLLKSALPKECKVIHGSRDYFSLRQGELDFEIIPTIKVKDPTKALNITDLSYFHVKYIKNKINKQPGLADEIRLAKAFTYYQGSYGAESYINGFSGYALELLMVHYKTFMNFLKAMVKIGPKKPKLIIDLSKLYKTRKNIEQELNKAKLYSPIILIDPTYKQRNALAALSSDTFNRFQKITKKFLAKPSAKFFELVDKNLVLEKKYGKDLIKVKLHTNKQAGDIAGTKLKKFHYYLEREIAKFFDIKEHHFDYDEDKNQGIIYLVVKPKKQLIIQGPPIKMKKAVLGFKKAHKNAKVSKGKLVAIRKLDMDFDSFLKNFIKDKKKIISEMSVKF